MLIVSMCFATKFCQSMKMPYIMDNSGREKLEVKWSELDSEMPVLFYFRVEIKYNHIYNGIVKDEQWNHRPGKMYVCV